jgi:2-dehydropantoate 2-reductase
MHICVVGAGAMGGSFAALLTRAGHEVSIIDTWAAHIDAVKSAGLQMQGALGDYTANLDASTRTDRASFADWAIVFTDSNSTADAAHTVAQVLKPDGSVITMQNGIGNVEKLVEHLGAERVVGGSSMCSAASAGPGHVLFTHLATTTIGELDGARTARIEALAALLESTGLIIQIGEQIMAKIWNKFVLNCGVNALCATTGLRSGEMTRIPELYALQSRIIKEALEVVAAKGIELPDSDPWTTIKYSSYHKFNQPSMLQHVLAGKRTEIDAINGALVREAQALGIATPYNEALVALLKGREHQRISEVSGEVIDYDAWESRIGQDPLPAVDER